MQKTVVQSEVNANSDGKSDTEKVVQFFLNLLVLLL